VASDGDEKMKSLKGTKTEKNVLLSFGGESQTRNRYSFFASQAKKEGYEQIAAIFLDTADNEKEGGRNG
jgi:rubrerythrin